MPVVDTHLVYLLQFQSCLLQTKVEDAQVAVSGYGWLMAEGRRLKDGAGCLLCLLYLLYLSLLA